MNSCKGIPPLSDEECKAAQALVEFAKSLQQGFSKPYLFQKEEHRKEDIEDSEEYSDFEDESSVDVVDVDEDEYRERIDEEKKARKTGKKRKQSRNPNACAAHKRYQHPMFFWS